MGYGCQVGPGPLRRAFDTLGSMIEPMPLATLAWIAIVMLAAGLLQGALGFGFPFVATPLIAMVSDMRTAIVFMLLPTLATILVALFTAGPLGVTLRRFWMMPLYMVV